MIDGLAARICSTSMPSFVRTLGSLLVRKTSQVAAISAEDVEPLGRREVEAQALLAPVRVLQQHVDVGAHHADAAGEEASHGVAPLDVLDLDDLGTPVGEQRRRGRHEGVLRDLEYPDPLHHGRHRIPLTVGL